MSSEEMHDCPRFIRTETCEKPNKSGSEWWKQLFKNMEEKIQIPYHHRREVLNGILPEEIFKRVDSILNLVNVEEKIDEKESKTHTFSLIEETQSEEESIQPEESDSFQKSFYCDPLNAGLWYLPSFHNIDHIPLTKKLEALGEEQIEEEEPQLIGKNNPYLKFFNCDPLHAAVWYPPPPRDIENMPLTEKSEALTEAIAAEFVEWLHNLGGDTPTTLDVHQVMKMFEIGFHTHASQSLAVRVNELPCVSKFITDIRKQPDKACAFRMKKKLMEDVKASRQKPRLKAFNTSLPQNLVYIPPRKDLVDKWIACDVPKRLSTMAAAFDGITHLRSTRTFCQWYAAESRKPRPKYLEELGMFNESFYLMPHYSISGDYSASSQEELDVENVHENSLIEQ
ncbi:hypothetical protein FQR65_LT08667 [Abscondita terminalis]|nr:hypothetical protein FQR65_LT08667 [Abscondita terminalis]